MCLPPVPEAHTSYSRDAAGEGGVWSLHPRDKRDSKVSVCLSLLRAHQHTVLACVRNLSLIRSPVAVV